MEPFKNMFNKKFVKELATNIFLYENSFKKDEFILHILKDLERFELKGRMRLISSSIHPFLALNYKDTINILKKVKTHFFKEESIGLQAMILPDYVEVYGLDDFVTSIDALKCFTINSSSEFAIRHLILKYERKTMQELKTLTKDENYHLRRLASEGCRPRLPWAISLKSFKNNPTLVLEILELLKDDKSMYVRKSVANNLNDISKDNPEIVIKFVKKNLGISKNLDWICKHGSRTLLKAGNKNILELFGYKNDDSYLIKNFNLDLKVKIEENLNFSFDLITSKKSLGNIRLEYMIYFQKANKKLSSKVFMLSQSSIKEQKKSFKNIKVLRLLQQESIIKEFIKYP
jgi:3-methyladenine DNA glycosylase AlkC